VHHRLHIIEFCNVLLKLELDCLRKNSSFIRTKASRRKEVKVRFWTIEQEKHSHNYEEEDSITNRNNTWQKLRRNQRPSPTQRNQLHMVSPALASILHDPRLDSLLNTSIGSCRKMKARYNLGLPKPLLKSQTTVDERRQKRSAPIMPINSSKSSDPRQQYKNLVTFCVTA